MDKNRVQLPLSVALSALDGKLGLENGHSHMGNSLCCISSQGSQLVFGRGSCIVIVTIQGQQQGEEELFRRSGQLLSASYIFHEETGCSISTYEILKEGEYITALLQVTFQFTGVDDEITWSNLIIIGTSHGSLQLHDNQGQLIHRAKLHTTQVKRIQCQDCFDDCLGRLMITFDRHIVTLSCAYLRNLQTINKHSVLPFKKWDMSRHMSKCLDSIAIMPRPADLRSAMHGYKRDEKPQFVVAGERPCLCSLDEVESGLSTLSSMTQLAASLWGWGKGGNSNTNDSSTQKSRANVDNNPLASSRGSLCEKYRAFADTTRQVQALCSSWSGKWIACSDSLGRVTIFSAHDLVILDIFKGYRDAQCGWLWGRDGCSELLVIFAPRRNLVEIWTLAFRSRIVGFTCLEGSRLLVPNVILGEREGIEQTCWMLDSEGGLWDLQEMLNQQLRGQQQ